MSARRSLGRVESWELWQRVHFRGAWTWVFFASSWQERQSGSPRSGGGAPFLRSWQRAQSPDEYGAWEDAAFAPFGSGPSPSSAGDVPGATSTRNTRRSVAGRTPGLDHAPLARPSLTWLNRVPRSGDAEGTIIGRRGLVPGSGAPSGGRDVVTHRLGGWVGESG